MDLVGQLVDIAGQLLNLLLHPRELIEPFGPLAYAILFAVLFAETGLFAGFFLPGDSLLIVAGVLAAKGSQAYTLDLWVVIVVCVTAAILGNLVDAGKARWLAVFSDRRLKKWPDVPTLFDLGYKIPASSPTGLVGPAGLPAGVVRKLHDAFKAGLADPQAVAMLERNAMDVYYKDPAAYAALIRESYAIEKERVERAGLLAKV